MLKVMNKKFSKNLLAGFIAICLIVNSFSFSLVAFGAAEFFSYENCISGMSSIIDSRKKMFFQYLEDHFKNNKQDSELVDDAVNAYRDYKEELWSQLEQFKHGRAPNAEQLDNLDACIRLIEIATLEAKDLLKMRARSSMRFKNTSILLEKYKVINNKLSGLNFMLAQIVAAFKTFNNKMPCFVKNCLTK
jgi:hypothetical protein